jgi:hypothetical protein
MTVEKLLPFGSRLAFPRLSSSIKAVLSVRTAIAYSNSNAIIIKPALKVYVANTTSR